MESSRPAAVREANAEQLRAEWWQLIAVLLIAAVWLYRTPYSASDLPIPPDTVEYALAPLQLLETGRYQIIVEGRGLPPRYPPWFPVTVILPAYALFGHEPGNAILPITAFAIAGVGFAYAIARRISSPAGGVLAAISVLVTPSYGTWATQVMTDVPSTALMLAGCLLFLRLRETASSWFWYLLAGTLVAITTLFRPVAAAMLLPFLFAAISSRRGFFRRAFALLVPMIAAAAMNFAYNAATFGSVSRNGYKLWVPVPVDYPSLMFSASNVRMNVSVITHTALPVFLALSLIASVFVRRNRALAPGSRRGGILDTLVFFALATVPILVFHLFYFFPGDRFHLPMIAGSAVIAGALLGLIVGRRHPSVIALLLAGVLVLAIAGRAAAPEQLPIRRIVADRVRGQTPDNSIIISAIDPVYMGRMAALGSSRRIVPLSRNVEYASKLLAWKRIDHPDPPPIDWRDGRCPGLIRGGAEEAVRFVAAEQLDALAAQIAERRPVFLETSSVGPAEANVLAALQGRFNLVMRAPYLFELQQR